MSGNPFDQFDAPPQQPSQSESGPNPFDKLDNATPPQTSEGLGLYQGLMKPLDNAATGAKWLANSGILPGIPQGTGDALDQAAHMLGIPSAQEAVAAHQHYIASREAAGEKPGELGQFAGNVLGTLPVAGLGPLAGGAASGALLSDDTSPSGVLGNAALGAAGGKLADVALGGLSRAAAPVWREGSNALSRVLGHEPDNSDIAQQANRYVSGLLDTSGKTPADLQGATGNAFGKPVLAAEAIGRPGVTALTALGRRQGTTPDALSGMLGERASGTRDRILGDYAQASGIDPAAASGDMDSIVKNGQTAAAPLYDRAYARGVVRTKPFSALMQAPAMQSAIGRATQIFGNEYAADRAAGNMGAASLDDWQKFVSGVSDKTAFPTQFLDYVKRGMDSQIESFRDPVTGKLNLRDPLVRSAQDIRQKFVGEAKKMNPDYGRALDHASDYLGANNAFQNGQKFILNPNVTADQLSNHLGGLSPPDAEAFKGGVANQLFNQSQNARLSPTLFDRPILQQKLGAVLGPDNASTFLQKMKVEAGLAKTGARMAPGTNSVTSDVMNATGEQDNNARAVVDGLFALSHGAHGNFVGAGTRAMSALRNLGVFGKTGGMPVQVRDEAGKLLMMKPEDLASYLSSAPKPSDPKGIQRLARVLSTMKTPARIAVVPALAQLMAPSQQ